MSVRHSQIPEILAVIMRHVRPEQVAPLLHELHCTQAGRLNQSFRDTIVRLKKLHEKSST